MSVGSIQAIGVYELRSILLIASTAMRKVAETQPKRAQDRLRASCTQRWVCLIIEVPIYALSQKLECTYNVKGQDHVEPPLELPVQLSGLNV